MNYSITEDLFSKVKDFINSQNGLFNRTELFKATYGENSWTGEAVKKVHPLDICIHMLVKCTSFIHATIWSGYWTKVEDIPADFTLEKLTDLFENSIEEDCDE